MRPRKSVKDSHTADADWKLWCRLCAKEDPQNNINIFFKEEHLDGDGANVKDLGLADAVRKYFWVDITRYDELPKMLCTECVSRVTTMVNFSERVSKVQQMFWALQSSRQYTKLYLESLRLKYGLSDEESEHVIERQLPEVHYVEEKPIIDELEDTIFKAEETEENPLETGLNSIKTNKKDISDKEKEYADNVSDLDDGDMDFVNETGSERDGVDEESSEQKTFKRITRKRSQISKVSVAQREEKPPAKAKKRYYKAKRKLKPSKRNKVSLLKKSLKNSKAAKDDDVEKPAAPTNNWINFEDETETDSDQDKDEDFVPPKYVKEKAKESDETVSQKEVKVRKRAKKIKGAAVCDVCKKVFQTHSILRKHKEIHDPNKHTCPKCGLQLNTRATFRDHMVVHSDEMKYKCEFCGRPFKRRNTMVMHRRLHSGLRPYLCEFCGRTFPTSVNCRTHKTLAHRKELAAIEASSECKTMQSTGEQNTQVENSQISI